MMPHVHSLTIFDVDRIEIKFDPVCHCYGIKLFTDGPRDATVINVWRNSNSGPAPELIVEGQPNQTILESAS
jgi:hypothetical protein